MKPGTVLLVEDDRDDADLTLMSLRQNAFGREVEVVRNGQAALDVLSGAERHKIALVILDLNLGHIGGLEVLATIRNHPTLKDLPVAVLTSSDEPRDKQEAYRLGVQGYFLKPINLDDFRPIVAGLRSILEAAKYPESC